MDNEIIIYQSQDGKTKIDVKIENDTVWLFQAQMVDLFQSSKANISEHISNLFAEGELDESLINSNKYSYPVPNTYFFALMMFFARSQQILAHYSEFLTDHLNKAQNQCKYSQECLCH
jgi:hypothetical protein